MKRMLFVIGAALVLSRTAYAGWVKHYGDAYNNEYAQSISTTTDGGYIVFGNITTGTGSNDAWLLKLNSQGDTAWTKIFGGEMSDYSYSGQQTADGGYIFAGSTESWGEGSSNVWLVKTNAAGDELWTKTYGGDSCDVAYSIQQTDDGGYIVTGTCDGYPTSYDGKMLLLKTDLNGNTMWTKTWDAVNPVIGDVGNNVRQTSDGGYIIACYADFLGTSGTGIDVMKTDDKGDTLWTYRDEIWFTESVVETSDGGFIATGFDNDDMFVFKLSSDGDLLWKRALGDFRQGYRDFGWCVQKEPGGGCIAAGQYSYNYSNDLGDVWLLKIDSDGDTVWARTYGSNPGLDEAYCVQSTSDGGYIMAGSSETWSNGGKDLLIIKTDSAGVTTSIEEPVTAYPLTHLEIVSSVGPTVTLRYCLSPSERGSLKLFDASGRMLRQLPVQGAGEVKVAELPQGVYFARLEVGGAGVTKKIVVVR